MKYTGIALALASTVLGQSLTEVLSNNTQLSSLLGLIGSVQLPALNNNTLLAPSNQAIAALGNATLAALAADPALVSAVLSYHILQGNYSTFQNVSFVPTVLGAQGASPYSNVTGGQRVAASASGGNVTFFSGLNQNSSVVNSSLPFSGGTVHIINRLLTVPQNISSTAVALNLTSAAGALIARGLVNTVDTTPDVTIFVPNNAAFQRIGSVLANATNATLDAVLTYHVVPNAVLYSTAIRNGSTAVTLQGGNLTLRVENGTYYVNNARVVLPNILVSNGVVHVIDRVLNPGNTTQLPNASATEEAFAGATSVSNVPFTSGVPTPSSSINTGAAAGTSRAASSSSSGGAALPMVTGAVGLAALFGGAGAMLNL